MDKKCVLIGYLGYDKTTLFNKICGQSQQADGDLESNTLNITESRARYGTGFILVDTPGLGAINDIFQHTTTIIAALTDGPINSILIWSRPKFRKLFLQFQNYNKLVTVILTHFDQIKKKDEYQQEIRGMIIQQFKINSVIFSGSQTQGETLCLEIENQLQRTGKILKFTDNQIEDLMTQIEYDAQLMQGKKDFQEKFKKFYNSVKYFLQGFQQNIQDQDQILHALHVFVRKQSQKIQENFEKQYGPIMEKLHQLKNDPVVAYYFHTVLKYSIINQVQELIDIINKKMIYPENHPYRCLRKCPNCSLIWYKVIGCDDITCGNRVQKQDEIKIKQQNQFVEKNYEFFYSQGKLECKELQKQKDLVQNLIYPAHYQKRSIKSATQQQNHTQLRYLVQQNPRGNIQQEREEMQFLFDYRDDYQRERIYGCGVKFNWLEASIQTVEELKLQHEDIFRYLSNKDQLLKKEYEIVRNELIKEVQRNKVVL